MTDPETIYTYSVELQKAQALNAELLAALKQIRGCVKVALDVEKDPVAQMICIFADAVIAKAEGWNMPRTWEIGECKATLGDQE